MKGLQGERQSSLEKQEQTTQRCLIRRDSYQVQRGRKAGRAPEHGTFSGRFSWRSVGGSTPANLTRPCQGAEESGTRQENKHIAALEKMLKEHQILSPPQVSAFQRAWPDFCGRMRGHGESGSRRFLPEAVVDNPCCASESSGTFVNVIYTQVLLLGFCFVLVMGHPGTPCSEIRKKNARPF